MVMSYGHMTSYRVVVLECIFDGIFLMKSFGLFSKCLFHLCNLCSWMECMKEAAVPDDQHNLMDSPQTIGKGEGERAPLTKWTPLRHKQGGIPNGLPHEQ